MLRFKGCQHFRLRLVLATLSGRAIRIDDIRSQDQSPGLRDFEANFLRLLEKLTNGCNVEINETGTSIRYRPGVIVCGPGLVHDCGTARSVGWFIEPLIMLALWGKKNLSITLKGVTNDRVDVGVDVARTVTLPLLKRLGVEDPGLELKIVKRGARPQGGGEVHLRVPFVKQLQPIQLTDEGMVKRVRGVAYSMKVSPQNANRMVDGARGPLNDYLADVYIFTDSMSGANSGNSPGFGLALVAETTSGCLLSAEACAASRGSRGRPGAAAADASFDTDADESSEDALLSTAPSTSGGSQGLPEALVVPEDVGRAASESLLEEIRRGGVVDSAHQSLILTLCALGPQEINEVRLGPLTANAIHTLRHLKDFFGVVFNIRTEPASQTLFLSCVGVGYKNVARKTT